MITDKDPQRAPGLEKVMARWRVDYIGKVLFTLGTVDAPDQRGAIAEAARQFHIPLAQRFRIRVTQLDTPKREQQ